LQVHNTHPHITPHIHIHISTYAPTLTRTHITYTPYMHTHTHPHPYPYTQRYGMLEGGEETLGEDPGGNTENGTTFLCLLCTTYWQFQGCDFGPLKCHNRLVEVFFGILLRID